MQTTINQRVESLIFSLEKGKQKRFAEKIDVAPTVVNNIVGTRQSDPSFRVLQKIVEAYSIVDLKWLMTGEGEMFKGEENAPQPKITSAESTRQENLPPDAIPLYDLDITAGNVQRLIEANDNIPLVGWLHLEDTASAKGLIGVGAKGNSMAPYINSGDTMLIRRVENLNVVPFGEAYVIITSEQSVVKYIRTGSTPGSWTLRSHNREFFEDFEIDKTEVKHLFMVVKVLKELTY